MATSQKERKNEKKMLIREAAYQCFQKDGYHDTTVDDICQKASCSKGSFYWHYNSKQEVFIDILNAWAHEIITEMLEQFEEALTEEEYVKSIIESMHRELRRGRVVVPLWLEFTAHARRDQSVQDALAKFYRRARAAVAELLRPSIRGRFTETDLQGIAATVFGAYIGLVSQELADPDGFDAAQAVSLVMPVIGALIQKLKVD